MLDIRGLRFRYGKRAPVLSGVDLTLEKALFQARAGFFTEIFGIVPVIRQRR